MLTWEQIRGNAIKFSQRWKDASDERSHAQLFLNEFFSVFGVDAMRVGTFEKRVHPTTDTNGYIDMLWPGRILVEMKSKGKSLDKAYNQARGYAFAIKDDEDLPEYIMVSDFSKIRLYRQTTNQKWEFSTKELSKHIKKFSILSEQHASKLAFFVDKELNTKAAYKMAQLHDILKDERYTGHALELYLVRLLFCLFADDSGIFNSRQFQQYIMDSKEDGSDLSGRLSMLFDVLNIPAEERQKSLPDDLKTFAYINGGLFQEALRPAAFDEKTRRLLLECCEFDWSSISPSIFGSMFQGVMSEEERRELGAHYTSEENILKVIKTLFLDELYAEFERVKINDVQLRAFHDKLSRLKFLDPACGCGNFLIITYRELRILELEVLKMLIDNNAQMAMGDWLKDYIKVNVNQFYGIEYEEFPCRIAQVGLWLMDHQMNNIVAEEFGIPFIRLPLKASASIVNDNALRIDWADVVPKNELNYILGNPPFIGNYLQNAEQKEDMSRVFKEYKNFGVLDYVCSWYKVASDYINGTNIKVAFVSTNSISQGDQPTVLWKPLMERGIKIDFAYRTFKWSNEAKGKAAVHCVIIGFSTNIVNTQKVIYNVSDGYPVASINQYLIDAPSVFLIKSDRPLCNVPPIIYGNKPVDGGNLIIEEAEYADFIEKEPNALKYIKRLMGAKEFIDGTKRWCLWLPGVSPSELKKMPLVINRIDKVRQVRLSSRDPGAQKLADTPTQFRETNNPKTAIIIPCHSSELRKYIPIGFIDENVIVTNAVFIVPNAGLYHFGILTSNVHMEWARAVCGRLKSDYRYSKDIVYNNFPWPNPTDEQRAGIEAAAQGVLDARDCHPDSSLADLYDSRTMPPELVLAHRKLNRAVWAAYGASPKIWPDEAACVADLMQRYKKLKDEKH